ncbi:MAG: hypothetical protein NVS4B12_21100 [Ktedonobacteraceae bacterium]
MVCCRSKGVIVVWIYLPKDIFHLLQVLQLLGSKDKKIISCIVQILYAEHADVFRIPLYSLKLYAVEVTDLLLAVSWKIYRLPLFRFK